MVSNGLIVEGSASAYVGPWRNQDISRSLLAALAARQRLAIPAAVAPQQLVNWLQKHELAAFAFHQSNEPELVPKQLASLYWSTVSANTIKLDLLATLLASFEAAGIKCVLLKGIAFCLTLYADSAVRPMSDLDLWVPRQDWPQVWDIMHRLGYHTEGIWVKAEDIPDYIVSLEFFPDNQVARAMWSIEIHSDLVAQPVHLIGRLPLATWWNCTYEQLWRGRTVHLLDPAAALLHTAVHQMFQHRGQLRLRWLLDIDQLVRGTPNYHLNDNHWLRLADEALAAGVLPALQTSLYLVNYWFNTPLPAPAQALLRQTLPRDQQLFFQKMAAPEKSTTSILWTDVRGLDSVRQRLTLLGQKIAPHPRYMMQRYHIASPLLLPAYYLWRWWRGLSIMLHRR